MKKFFSTIAVMGIINFAYSQVKYDNGPLSTANNFVTVGTWGRSNITFNFVNGTNDIAGTDERIAIRQAFQLWSDYANLNFTEVTGTGDISISWAIGNHGDGAANALDGAGGVLAHAFLPNSNAATGLAGDMHYDDDETWTMAARPNPFTGQPIDLVTVAAHEIGHALGLDHSTVNCALMNAFYNGSHRYLAQDDIDGIRSIYGRRDAMITNSTAALCTSATYYFRNIPTGATINWVSANTSIATVNNQGLVTRAAGANGNVRITGTITLPCGTNVIEFRDILVGSPNTLTGTYSTATSTVPMQTFNSVPIGNIYAQYQWSGVSNPVASLSSGSPAGTGFYSNPNMFSFNISSGQTISIYLTATGACGQVNATRTFAQSSYSSYSITASPNPAKGRINVAIAKVVNTSTSYIQTRALKNNAMSITKMSLYNYNTNALVKQWTYQDTKSKNYSLDIMGIKSGYYVLKMERDNKTATTKILIQ